MDKVKITVEENGKIYEIEGIGFRVERNSDSAQSLEGPMNNRLVIRPPSAMEHYTLTFFAIGGWNRTEK